MITKIALRAFELEDAEFVNSLRSIERYENLIGGNKNFVSLERDRKWIEDLILKDYQDKMYMAIYRRADEDKQIIGYISLGNIDHRNKSCCWFGVKLHPDYNGKGMGTESALLLMKYVFEELSMERYEGICIEEHTITKKLFKKIGFKVEGILRNSVFKNGKYHNQILHSILKSEYPSVKQKFEL